MMNIVSEGLKEIPLNLDKYNEYVSRRFPELHLDNESLRLENGLLRLQIDQLRLEKTDERAAGASRPESPLKILVK